MINITKGGYQIIDFEQIEFETNTYYIIDGIYNKLINTNKTILISGLNVNGQLYRDSYASVIKDSDYFIISLENFTILVFSNNMFKILNVYNGVKIINSDVGFNASNGYVLDYDRDEIVEQYKKGGLILRMENVDEHFQSVVGMRNVEGTPLRLLLRSTGITIYEDGYFTH